MSKITPFLWFNNQAEEAMQFYTSVFKHAKVHEVTRYGDAGPMPKGTVMTASFELEGMPFTALNGGPHYNFNQAVSFVINCDNQGEIDYYWDKLTEGGKAIQCGWLTDKFGLVWQVVPTVLPKLLKDKDPAKASRVMHAMMKMVKFDIAGLEAAAEA